MGYQIHIFSRIGNFDSGIPPIPFILRQITDPLPCPQFCHPASHFSSFPRRRESSALAHASPHPETSRDVINEPSYMRSVSGSPLSRGRQGKTTEEKQGRRNPRQWPSASEALNFQPSWRGRARFRPIADRLVYDGVVCFDPFRLNFIMSVPNRNGTRHFVCCFRSNVRRREIRNLRHERRPRGSHPKCECG